MTAGSDGVMSFWDFKARNKIKSFSYGSTPICDAQVSPSGQMVAYALGNDWHVGAEGVGKWQTRIGVHVVTDQETRYMGLSK
jgi:WD40 repeat protein